MSSIFARLPGSVLPALVGLGLTGAVAGAVQAGSADAPLRCEIRESAANGMTSLVGIVEADVAVSGSYSFRVKSSGGGGQSDIRQGGEFAAGPGQPATLGSVMLGQPGATFDATLEVTSGGRSIACSERIAL